MTDSKGRNAKARRKLARKRRERFGRLHGDGRDVDTRKRPPAPPDPELCYCHEPPHSPGGCHACIHRRGGAAVYDIEEGKP